MSRNEQNRIASIYRSANGKQMREGIDWYPGLRRVAESADKNLSKSVGVMAAISPLKTRKHLIGAVPKIFEAGTASKTGLGADKANQILNGACPTKVLGGRLVKGLFDSVLFPNGDISPRIDKYSYELAIGRKVDYKTFKSFDNSDTRFDAMAKDYRAVAEHLSVSVPQLQAITWCVWRDAFYPKEPTKK